MCVTARYSVRRLATFSGYKTVYDANTLSSIIVGRLFMSPTTHAFVMSCMKVPRNLGSVRMPRAPRGAARIVEYNRRLAIVPLHHYIVHPFESPQVSDFL
jgi:hypothetical protein